MKIPVYVYAEAETWGDKKILYKPYYATCMDHIGMEFYQCEIDIPVPDRADVINRTVKLMRAKQSRIRADAEVKTQNIEEQIGRLLSIEDRSQDDT